MCSNQRGADGSSEALDADYWRRQATDLAARGLRLLAPASKPATAEQRTLNFADVESGLTLLALVGITTRRVPPSPPSPNASAPASG